ncbi:MAG: transcription termination/antitermination protein NusA [Chloroflexota bacterium]|jgi:N utilization substance protein A|nr:transcription termination/antitermination protein NusA [Chloroflexota bacterium]
MAMAMGELLGALDQLQQEKGFSKDGLIQVIEEALAEAYRQRHEPEGEVEVRIDVSTGALQAGIHTHGEYQPIPAEEFQSAAATTARKVIFGRLRDAEREQVFQDALKHQGELASAVVDRLDGNLVFVRTDRGQGETASEALLPPEEQIPTETYHPGQRLKVLLLEPRVGRRGPSQVVSRTNRSLVKRLLEFEVPEIVSGQVLVKALAREAGLRTKLAVESSEDGLDPVGACVGPKGARIRAVVDELNGERVDVLEWADDPDALVANALSPARVTSVSTDVETRTATVMVPAAQLSLAIGKDGQNARLAARLTGWRIDIKGVEGPEEAPVAREAAPRAVAEATEEARDEAAEEAVPASQPTPTGE